MHKAILGVSHHTDTDKELPCHWRRDRSHDQMAAPSEACDCPIANEHPVIEII